MPALFFISLIAWAEPPAQCDYSGAKAECEALWAEHCEEDRYADSCEKWRIKFSDAKKYKDLRQLEKSAEPLPKGCIKSFTDLKNPGAKTTAGSLNAIGGWNHLVGNWSLDPALTSVSDKTASAVFSVEDGVLAGKLIQKHKNNGRVLDEQSGRIAMCTINGRFEIWRLDASGEKGSAMVLLMKSKITGAIDLVPLIGEHKDKVLLFNKTNPDGTPIKPAVSR